MSELILELYTEEIPAFMQKKAEEAYHTIFTNTFEAEDIMYQSLSVYVGPRRLVLHVQGLPDKSLAKHIELKGPKVGAPEQALEGFCKASNITKDDLIVKSIKDQDHYMYEFVKPEIVLTQILPTLLQKAISEYIWPKSMYWGSYEMKWVRPMLNVMCIFAGKVLNFSYFHLKANNQSFGHRFIAHDSFTVSNWDEYISALQKAHVVLERQTRLDMITRGIEAIQEKHNLLVDMDPRLVEEVSGLVEYPNVLIGRIPEKFMNVPNEILSLAMKTHQRYFTTRSKDGTFAPYFMFVTNLPTGGDEVASGNEKVLSARLADAAYFYNQDQKKPLESRLEKLKEVVFHAKLGSIYDKTMRLVKLAEYLKPNDKDLAKAALLCKCDLATEAVSEFPELQGVMGGYYAALEGCSDATSSAIRNHYLPLGNNDEVPTDNAAFLALADKMDSLVSLIYAGERATGSKDPYALRRYALGVIKIILQNSMEVNIKELIKALLVVIPEFAQQISGMHSQAISNQVGSASSHTLVRNDDTSALSSEILTFIEERLKYFLKEEYDIGAINAAVDLSIDDDLCITAKKVKALHDFMQDTQGDMLVQLYKRVTNILGSDKISGNVEVSKFKTDEEHSLYNAIEEVSSKIATSLDAKDFESTFSSLNLLKDRIAEFFDKVMVNDADQSIAQNRKLLLSSISNIFNQIARFEKL